MGDQRTRDGGHSEVVHHASSGGVVVAYNNFKAHFAPRQETYRSKISDEVASVRHVADLGPDDGLNNSGCWVGQDVDLGWIATSTVGVWARCAASPLWVAPRPGVGSVAAFRCEGVLMLRSV